MDDLQRRLGKIQVGETRERKPIYAADLDAAGAMTALLRDALMPNLVQTLEHNPAFIHGGPFANIAHGCNSVIATETALKLADFVVTEAGFGADLGAEKFFDIKCRKAGLRPEAAVLVATVRALKSHGGVERGDYGAENVAAVKEGLANLDRHIRNLKSFGVPVIVGVNQFDGDTEAEMQAVVDHCASLDVEAIVCSHWANGGAGTEELATRLVAMVEGGTADFRRSIPTTCRFGTRCAPLPARFMAPRISTATRRYVPGSARWRRPARRHADLHGEDAIQLSPPTRTCGARRAATSFPFARCDWLPGPNFSWWSAATS